MNFLHLKYVVEISKAKSINKAAENLFMAQPNLSRIIKDLEESLNFQIFKRTSKGMELTERGSDFVSKAERILQEVETIEATFSQSKGEIQEFSISVPRASYVSNAFKNFLKRVDNNKSIDFNYKETNALKVIHDIEKDGFRLGVLRYSAKYEDFYTSILVEKKMEKKEIFAFNYVLLMSKYSVLAQKESITMDDLKNHIEVLHGDPYIPTLSSKEAKKAEFSGITNKNIFIYERGSQFEILHDITETYMWVSPMPKEILDRYGLVEKPCKDYNKTYKDALIYAKDYNFTSLDKLFLEELLSSKQEVVKTLNDTLQS